MASGKEINSHFGIASFIRPSENRLYTIYIYAIYFVTVCIYVQQQFVSVSAQHL